MKVQNKQSQIHIDSEIAPLKKVLIHTPGLEIECMTPEETHHYLFHSIVFLKDLLKGYSVFKNVLSKVAQVYEIRECLAEVLEDRAVRKQCLTQVLYFYGHAEFMDELLDFDSQTLARLLIEGFEHKSKLHPSPSSVVSGDRYILQPLPNLYFTRDTSIVVGSKLISPHMAHSVRFVETILTHTIFAHHPNFRGDGFLLDAFHADGAVPFTLEGGDIHVWHKDLYLVGESVRTNLAAVDVFVDALIRERKHNKDDTPFHVLVVLLPKTLSMIHLDMMFTRISEHQALGYAPALIGAGSLRTVKISVNHFGQTHREEMGSLLTALKSVGYSMDPVFCGDNKSLVQQEREQWASGTNSFALAPGKIVCYENEHTLRALERAGFKIVAGTDFVKNSDTDKSQENVVITIDGSQLSQGGGGPRCMTCPLLR